jgi:hypothetical protein
MDNKNNYGKNAKLCPHNILGVTKCKLCLKETRKKWKQTHPHYLRERYRRIHPNSKAIGLLCPHGIKGKSNCKLCEKEASQEWHKKHPHYQSGSYRRKHIVKKNMFICPHGVIGKSHCKECKKELTRKWKATHLERSRELRRLSYRRNPERQKELYLKHRPKMKKREKEKRATIKRIVIDHYGGKCSCCGESEIDFLTIGHINDDGDKHREEIGQGARFYKKLYDANFKTEYELTVECFNCNYGKRINHGSCPHNKVRI